MVEIKGYSIPLNPLPNVIRIALIMALKVEKQIQCEDILKHSQTLRTPTQNVPFCMNRFVCKRTYLLRNQYKTSYMQRLQSSDVLQVNLFRN